MTDITAQNLPNYATLNQATVTINEMGDKTITTQMKIDGDITPEFVGTDNQDWRLTFKNEDYILPIREPQASKGNESRNSIIDLTFYHKGIYQLKRYYFVELASVDAGTAIADKYKASMSLTLPNFVTALQNILNHYFGNEYTVTYDTTKQYSSEPVFISIDYSHIWDVLQSTYETFGVRWTIQQTASGKYAIRIGFDGAEISHEFEYGYEGGLLKFERQVQSDDIKNILLGRGGSKNLPKLYFKDYSLYLPTGITGGNGGFTPDPDAIPELRDVYFNELRDINFRYYIQGWAAGKGYGDHSIDSGKYANQWAYKKGYDDATLTGRKFDPVEYVKNSESIEKYGEKWGALDANEDIYPTIQGKTVSGLGRIDETVAVSEVTTDDMTKLAESSVVKTTLPELRTTATVAAGTSTYTRTSEPFTVPAGQVGNVAEYNTFISSDNQLCTVSVAITAVPTAGGSAIAPQGMPAGEYRLNVVFTIANTAQTATQATFGIQGIVVTSTSPTKEEWKPTFDIWVKNIWGTSIAAGETATQYADRVWLPILGDREGGEARVVFSTGFLASSSDYEFTIVGYEYDTSKTYDGVSSHWKLTLAKSDAEVEATGLYIPNATTGGNAVAGDKFFFIGCDMPFQYVEWAEETLNGKKNTAIESTAEIQPSWVVTLDKIRINEVEDGEKIIDTLAVGSVVTLSDDRFVPDSIELYIQTLTYKWEETSLVPDVEIVLSNEISTVQSTVETIQGEIDTIKNNYVTDDTIRASVEKITKGTYLRKSGAEEVSYSPTQFAATVTEKDFQQGDALGHGWGMYKDGDGNSVVEADKIVVRKKMSVNELVVNQVSYMGGKQIISAASIVVSRIDKVGNNYKCYFDQKQGSVKNLFVVNDIAMGQVYSPDTATLRYYKYKVNAIGDDYIVLDSSYMIGDDIFFFTADNKQFVTSEDEDFAVSSGRPEVGDTLVQFGNYTDTDRQYVIVRDVIGGGYETMLKGLNNVSADGVEYYFAGRRSGMYSNRERFYIGDTANYIEYLNGTLKVKADIELVSGSTFEQRISGDEANIATLQSTASHIFTSQPTGPYKVGDLWTNASSFPMLTETNDILVTEDGDAIATESPYSDDILVCTAARATGFDITDWRPASGYVPDISYLKAALGNDIGTTQISGGLLLGTFIGVKDSNANVVAGFNATTEMGYVQGHGRLMLFAGSTNAASVDTANFRVYEDGHLVANSAEIHGAIYATSGEFGGNVVIGATGGRRVEIQAGNYGTMDMFDAGNNITTHIGNDYCATIANFVSSVTPQPSTIPSSNWSKGFPRTGRSIQFHQSMEYTGKTFTVVGDQSANKIEGNIPCYLDVSPEPATSDMVLTLHACTDISGSNFTTIGVCKINATSTGYATGTMQISAVLPSGTFYLFYSCNGSATYNDSASSRLIVATVGVTATSCTVTTISQRLNIFANGFGYRYSTEQYFAVIREATSYAASGDLAFKVRTGTAASPVGFDVVPTGLKIYGKARTQLGYKTGSLNAGDTITLSESFKNYSFIEIRATFWSSQRVVMLMSTEEWSASSSAIAIQLTTDSEYLQVYRSSNTQATIGQASRHATGIHIFGIL